MIREVKRDMERLTGAGDIDGAVKCGLRGIKQYPTSGEMYGLLAGAYKLAGNMLDAYKNYVKAETCYLYTEPEGVARQEISKEIEALSADLVAGIERAEQENDGVFLKKALAYIEQKKFFLMGDSFRSNGSPVIGKYCWVNEQEKKYIANYRNQLYEYFSETDSDVTRTKAEMRDVTVGTEIVVEGDTDELLLPIAVENPGTEHEFSNSGEPVVIRQMFSQHYNYYRIKNHTAVRSSGKSYYGEPIPLKHSPKRKKLVLNIFVDGLSGEILKNGRIKQLMPNTYRFFGKGVICEQAYVSGEWTYPSIASFFCGGSTLRHMMFHNNLDVPLPEDMPTLTEYFKQAGYYTAILNGDWRITPNYGYTRGVDQYVYKISTAGYKVEQIIGEAIDHIEAFKETDQYLWVTVDDLHDVADGFDLTLAVQTQIPIRERGLEKNGSTSAKQAYSETKIAAYKRLATQVDLHLGMLYAYLEQNYREDEIIVSLMADHGQAYMVPADSHFLAKERERVAFMFRGGNYQGITDELVSSCDYLPIICHLAGIPMKPVEIDGQLPRFFGGGTEREFVMSESLHPGDSYYLTLFAKEYTVYFENESPIQDDGTFELNYTLVIEDGNGERITDEEMNRNFLALILEHIKALVIR